MSGQPVNLMTLIRRAKTSGDYGDFMKAIPYAVFLGLEVYWEKERLNSRMRYSDKLMGRPMPPSLHGGTVGALLEHCALMEIIHQSAEPTLPKTIDFSIDYLRRSGPQDVFAEAEITKHGRRVANVRVIAWQDERERPVAAGHGHFLIA